MSFTTLENQLNKYSLNYTNKQLDKTLDQLDFNTQSMSGKTSSGLDAIYANLTQQLTCDSECQKRKNIDTLRKQWQAAEMNERKAPNVTSDAEKKYLIASEGTQGYNDTMMKRYTNVAHVVQQSAKQSHKDIMNELTSLNENYEAETNSLEQINKLLDIKLSENTRLLNLVDQNMASVQTNDRKVVYAEWANQWLGTVNNALRWLYIIFALAFIYKSSFVTDSKWKTFKGWIIPIGLFVYPFLIYYIASYLVIIYNKSVWFLEHKAPKNVYSQL